MGLISLSLPQVGQPNSTEETKIPSDFTILQNVINGNLDSTNVSATLAQSAGVNYAGQTVKGAANIATSENTTSTSYTTLTTPDQVTGIVLPTNGLIAVCFQANWSCTATGGRAAIFVGANQLKAQVDTSTGVNAVSTLAACASSNSGPLVSAGSYGIVSSPNNTAAVANVTTGQAVGLAGDSTLVGQLEIGGVVFSNIFPTWGAPTYIFAAAGTYTVAVKFKVASGTLTASSRQLWVEAVSFA